MFSVTRAAFLFLVLVPAVRSHAEEAYPSKVRVETLVKTSQDNAGQPIRFPTGAPELTGVMVTLPPGESTGWHIHAIPCAAYILEGEVSVEVEGRGTSRFKAGDAFAEVVNLRHCGTNPGSKPVKILLFAMGEKGVPISEKK
jgi:quercetin dioxygenase-like cupin family protein